MKILISLVLIINLLAIVTSQPILYLYTQKNKDQPEKVDLLTNSTFFIRFSELKVLIHGFGDNPFTTALQLVKNEILAIENVNVVLVDWQEMASFPNYLNAVDKTKYVGATVALFIVKNYIDPKSVHCIGHSLGAHTCGFVGKHVKIRRISGLDPAGPNFRSKPPSERLDKSDADFVDVIHVDSFYGIQEEIGHKNFYPSGGKNQPGCGLSGILPSGPDDTVNFFEIQTRMGSKINPVQVLACSHIKVPRYFAESIRSECKFNAVLCSDYDAFKKGKCKCSLNSKENSCSQMGYYSDLDKTSGNYYLDVGKDEPYCKI